MPTSSLPKKGRGGYAKLASVAKIYKKKTKREYTFLFMFMREMRILRLCSQAWIKERVP